MSKRKSLRDKLDRLSEMDDGATLEFFDMLDKDVEQSIGFRYHAPLTQARQNHHLEMYFAFMQFVLGKPKDTPDEVMKVEAFPADIPKLCNYLQKFLIYVFRNATPRSRATGDTIQYRVLTHYRDSMMFWAMRILNERDVEVRRSKLYNAMTESMRFVQMQYGSRIQLSKPTETSIGLSELRQLIDYEMFHNICIENSEQHQVAWCIGRVIAVRPGTLCPSRHGRADPITWENIEFTAGSEPGMFNVKIGFPDIAIKAPEDPERSLVAAGPHHLKATITSPSNADGLIFSVAHRLLTVAIRRGILEGISSIEDLMNTNLHYVQVKKTHLKDPIFFRSIPKGTALDPPHPLTAGQLSSYLSARGLALGYNGGISFYSLRRKAATDLTRRLGADQARNVMGHAPESRTLERHYLELAPLLDLSRVLTEQPIEAGGYSSTLMEQDAPLGLSRLNAKALEKTRGIALSAYTNLLIRLDPDCPKTPTPQQLKLYRKAMRNRAKREIIAKEAEIQKSGMTREDFEGRKGALNASAFAKSILERSQAALKEAAPDPSDADADEGPDPEGDDDLDSLFEEDDEYEEDIEESARRGTIGYSLFVQMDEEPIDDQVPTGDQGEHQAIHPDVTFKDLATSFMQTLMENTLTTYTGPWNKGNTTCPMCQDDDTVGPEEKAKAWSKPAHLERHMGGTFHSPKSRWKRRMKKLYQQTKTWLCPYCSDPRPYPSLGDVTQHLKNYKLDPSNPEKVRHERLRDEDGWFEDEWAGTISKERERSRERQAKRAMKDVGIEFVPEDELLEPVPVPGRPGLMFGPMPPMQIPPHLQHNLRYGDPEPIGIPPHLQHKLRYGDPRPLNFKDSDKP